MRYLLTLTLFLVTYITYAQAPKIMPGIFLYNISINDDHKPISRSGNTAVIKPGSYQYVFIDLLKGVITKQDKQLLRISSDHRYFFESSTYAINQPFGSRIKNGWQTRSAGIQSDTALRTLITDHIAHDVDERGNILASKIWYDSTNWYWTGMKGLYKLDRTSGKVLQTINEDTIFVCKDRTGCAFMGNYLQKNYYAFGAQTYRVPIDIYPFDGSKKITIPSHDYHTVFADSTIIFTVGDSTLDYRKITAFDVRTGQQLAQKRIDRPANKAQVFRSSKNKMYILQSSDLIEEWSVTKDGFTITKTWDLNAILGLAKDQYYEFFVTKGPSFLLMPSKMDKAEAGGSAANTAHFMNGSTNKITMQVSPFYNRTADDVVKQKIAKDKQDAFVAKYEAEKDSLAHPEKYCHHFWNTTKWRKGLTIFWGGGYHIIADYDCKNDKYKLWQPAQLYEGKGHYMQPKYVMVPGGQFRAGDYYSRQQYVTCTECEGDGTYERTIYTTKTKELPWGYFSGIETKKITTKATTVSGSCPKCMGNGVVLQ